MSSQLFERTCTLVAEDPRAPQALSALNELAGSEGPRSALEAAAAARHVLLSKGDYDGAELIFQRELALAPDGALRAEVLAEMARYYRDFLRDKARAIDCFVNAFELDTTRMDLLEEVGAVYHQKESFDDLVARLKEEAASAKDPKAAARWFAEMADVQLKMLDKPTPALAAAYDALKLDSMNLRARGIAEAVLIQESRWPELATFYKRAARDSKDLNDRVALLFRLASTWRDKLKDPLQTMETYEEIVSAAPNNIRIYGLIDELKGERETWQKVGNQLTLQARAAKNKDDAALNWALAGKVFLKYLADDASAADCYLQLVKADPTMPGALKALRDLATRRNDPRLLARGLADAAKGTPDTKRRRDLYRELGTLYRGPLAAPSLAADAFASALVLDPNDASAAEQLEALYAELGEWESLAEHLKKRIAGATPDRAPTLLARLGEVLAERMGQPAAAMEAYEDALSREPAHRPSLLALERLYRASKQWSEVARVYRGLASSAPDEAEAIRVHKALASVLLEQLHDIPGGAAELELALKLDRDDREIWEGLEAAYASGERWDDLLRIYADVPVEGAAPAGASGAPAGDEADRGFRELARSWYRKAAELCARRLGDPAQAALWYRRARLLDPEDTALRDALAAQYQAAEEWNELVMLLEEEAAAAATPEDAAAAFLRAGGVAEEKMSAPEKARALYEAASKAAPADPAPLKALERVYLRADAWDRLAEVYAAQARLSRDTESRAAAVRRLARLERDRLKRPARAAEAYQTLAELIPDDREAIDALRTLLADQRRWQELLAAHAKALSLSTTDAAKAQILREMAELLRTELRDPDGALARLEQALALEPDDRATLDQAASLYALHGRFRELIDVRLRAIPHATPAQAVDLHLEIASAAEKLDPPDATLAREHYLAALAVDARRPEAFGGLRRLYQQSADARGLAELADRELALSPPDARRAELYKEQGHLFESELADPVRAMACYQAAAEILPDDVEPLGGIRRLLAARNAWAEYAKVAETEAAKTSDPQAAAALHRELAELWEKRFGQPQRAAGHLRKVLEIAPMDTAALLALANCLEEAGDDEERDQVLARLSHAGLSEGDRAKALRARARIAAESRHDPAEAIDLYRQAVALVPDDADALARLAELLEAKQEWRELLDVLTARRRALARREDARPDRAATLRAIGDLWRLRLQNGANAAEAYREALLEAPEAATLSHLADVEDDPATFDGDVKRTRARAGELGIAESTRAQVEIAAGNAWLGRYGDPAPAAECFAEAARLDPKSQPARTGLENALEASEQWVELADAQESAAASDPDPLRAARRFTRAASVARDRLDDTDRAIRNLQAAIARRPEILAAPLPEDRGARDGLIALFARGKRWEDLRDLYLAAIEQSPANPVERSPLRLGLGDLYRDRFAQPDDAKKQYELAAEEDPRNARAQESLAELALSVGDDAAFARHAAAAAEALSPHPRAAAWLRRAADASLRGGDATQAAALARRALALEPRDAAGLESLAAALRARAEDSGSREEWDELAKTLSRRLALPAAAGGKRGLMAAELARIHAAHRDDPDEAARVWERALAERSTARTLTRDEEAAGVPPRPVDEHDLAEGLEEERRVAREAAEFFEQSGRWSGLALALERLSEVDVETERAGHLRRLAEVLSAKLSDKAAAARALERLCEIHADDVEALEALARLYRESRDWEKLLKVYERAAIAAKDPAAAVETLRTLAEVWEKRLGSAEGASGAYRRLLELEPDDVDGAEGLRRCLTALGRWAQVVDADLAALPSAAAARRSELWLEVARLKRDRLDDHPGAAEAFEKLLADEQVPGEVKPGALAELASLYVDLGRWRDAARIEQERAAASTDPKDAAQRLVAAARLLAERLGDQEAAIELLESSRARPLPSPSAGPRPGDRIADAETLESALEDLYERNGRHDALEKLLAARPVTGESRRKRAALLAGPLHRAREALALYRQAVNADETDAVAAEALRDLSRAEHSKRDLALAYTRLIDQANDPARKADLLCEAASEAFTGKKKRDALERAVSLDPECRRAVRALRERAERQEDWRAAAEWLEKEEALCPDAAEKADVLGHKAHALANAGDGPAAIAAFKAALAVAPHRADLLESLADLAFREGDWDEAARAYERLARSGGSAEKPAELSRRQGEIALRRGKEDEAIAHFQDALAHEPGWPLALKPLARLHAERGQWKLAARALASLLEKPDDLHENDRIEARVHLGEARARIGDPRGAAEAFRQVLEEKPGHLGATLGLAEALASAGEGAEALGFLEKFAAESKDVERRRDALRRVGELKLAAGDADGARTAFADAVKADPADRRAVEALAKLHADRGEWLEVLSALTELANATPAGAKRGEVYREIAETYDRGLGDQLKAREFYDKALADDPSDAESERALGTLLGRLGHWSDLADHLVARIEATPEGPARDELLLERGRLLRDRLENPGGAAEVFGQVVAASPERADARRELARALAATSGRGAEAVAEYRRLVHDDPSDLDAMAGLADAAAAEREEWRADAANAALAWAGARAADGGGADRRGSFVAASGMRLSPEILRKHLVDPGEANPFFDALREIDSETPEVLAAVDPDPTGPVPPLAGEAARLAEAAAALAGVLGAPEPQVAGVADGVPALLAGHPPRIGLPPAAPNPAVMFALGRHVDALRDSRHRLVLRDAAGVQGLFAALAAATLGDGAGGPASPDLVRSIKKTFGWRTRRTLRPILEPLANRIGAFDFVAWRNAVLRTGARAGLLVCGDLATALEAIAPAASAGDTPERRAERLRNDAAAADLVRWALSDDYAAVRAALLKS